MRYPITPDGRYFVAKGRLWRCTDPSLPPEERTRWVKALMQARRAVREAKRRGDLEALKKARRRVDEARGAGAPLVGGGAGLHGEAGGKHPLSGRVP